MGILFFVCHGNAVRPGRIDLVTLGNDVELRRCQMNGKFTKMKGSAFNVHGNKDIDGPKNLFKQVINHSDYFGPNSQKQQQQQYRNIEIFIGKNPGFLGIYEWDGTPNKYPIKCQDNNPKECLFYLDEFHGKDYEGIRDVVKNKGYILSDFNLYSAPNAICIIGCFPPEVRINTATNWHPQDLSKELIDIPQLIEYGKPENFLWKSFWLRTRCKQDVLREKVKQLSICLNSHNPNRKLQLFPNITKEDIRLLLNIKLTFPRKFEDVLTAEINKKNTNTNGIYNGGACSSLCSEKSDKAMNSSTRIEKYGDDYFFNEIEIEPDFGGGSKRKKKKSKKKKTKRRKSRKSKRRKSKTLRPSRKSYRRRN